jgi:ABC-2 type transport system permease protein
VLILSNVASFEVKNIKFSSIDHDHSGASRELIRLFQNSDYFKIIDHFKSKKEANVQMEKGKVDVIMEILNHFERSLLSENKTTLSVIINAIDGAAAVLENVYITQIIANFNQKTSSQLYQNNDNTFVQPQSIVTIPSFWYNNTLNYKTLMVSGIVVLSVTMRTLFYRL